MEIEYLDYECEVIELDDAAARNCDTQAQAAAAEAVFASWFTDWRNRSVPEANTAAD